MNNGLLPLAEMAVLNRTFPFYGSSCARLLNGFQSHLTDCAAVWSWIAKVELFQMLTIPAQLFFLPKALGDGFPVPLGQLMDRLCFRNAVNTSSVTGGPQPPIATSLSRWGVTDELRGGRLSPPLSFLVRAQMFPCLSAIMQQLCSQAALAHFGEQKSPLEPSRRSHLVTSVRKSPLSLFRNPDPCKNKAESQFLGKLLSSTLA